MSSQDFLIDASSRHAALLQMYSDGVELKASNDVANALKSVLADLAATDKQTKGIRLQIVSKYRDILTDIEQSIYDEMIDLAVAEGEFTKEMFEQVIDAEIAEITAKEIANAVDSDKFKLDDGTRITAPAALAQFTARKAAQINTIINDGFTSGEDQASIIKRVREVEPMQRNQAASLVRTTTNMASSTSRKKMFDANRDVLKGYQWVSTLDGHTSLICISLDSKVFRIGAGPMPPAHWSCRSTTVPVVNPKFDLLAGLTGTRPAVGGKGAKSVSAKTSYPVWLKRQPVSFQNEVLGVTRAELFRKGGLPVSKFVNLSGRTYTLDELRALNPLAFEKAGL